MLKEASIVWVNIHGKKDEIKAKTNKYISQFSIIVRD